MSFETRIVDGPRLVKARTAAGMSQAELAEAAGCDKRTIERGEKGEKLRPKIIAQIAKALDIAITQLIVDPNSLRAEFKPYLDHLKLEFEDARYLELRAVDPGASPQDYVPKVQDMFVVPNLLKDSATPESVEPGQCWDEATLADQVVTRSKHLVILGDPGSGKSTLVAWLTMQMCEASELSRALGDRLPVTLILREVERHLAEILRQKRTRNRIAHLSWEDLIRAFQLWCGKSKEFADSVAGDRLLELVKEGKVLLLLDGLDEMGIEIREELRTAVWELLENYPENVVICTSRPIGYQEVRFDERPLKAMLSEYAPPSKFPTSQCETPFPVEFIMQLVHLAPFTDDQIQRFVLHWYTKRLESEGRSAESAEKLNAAIQASESTTTLARIPNILTLMAGLHERRQVLPDGRARLYSAVTDLYLTHIDQMRGIDRGLKARSQPHEQKLWLGRIAWEIQLRRVANSQLPMGERPDDNSVLLVTVDEMVEWIQEERRGRLTARNAEPDPDEPRHFLDVVRIRAGLLIDRKEGNYSFVHLSFVEYFAGYYLLLKHEKIFAAAASASSSHLPPGEGPGVRVCVPAPPPTPRTLTTNPLWHEPLIFAFEEGHAFNTDPWENLVQVMFPMLVDHSEPGWTGPGPDDYDELLVLAQLGEDGHSGFSVWRAWIQSTCRDWVLKYQPLHECHWDCGNTFRSDWLEILADPADRRRLRWELIERSVVNDQLTCLEFDLTAPDVEQIVQRWPNLTTLDLWNNEIGEAGARAIAEQLTNLTTLDLGGSQIGAAGAQAIAERLTNLATLHLGDSQVGAAGAKAIVARLTNLTSLDLGGSQIGAAGAQAIAEQLTNLTTLHLWDNQIGDTGARAIAERLPNLTELYLGGNQIGDSGAQAIATQLTNLTTLNLGLNQIGDAGAQAIATRLTNLTTLYLGGNQISDTGARAIAERLTNLTTLNLLDNEIGKVVQTELRTMLPNCEIDF